MLSSHTIGCCVIRKKEEQIGEVKLFLDFLKNTSNQRKKKKKWNRRPQGHQNIPKVAFMMIGGHVAFGVLTDFRND